VTRRAARAAIGLLLAVAACQPAPSAAPSGAPSSPVPGGSVAATPPAATGAASSVLGDALRDAISVDDIVADLGRLGEIAAANGGHRAAGTPGHDASVDFAAGELRAAGYQVTLQPVPVQAFIQQGPTVLEIPGETGFADLRDYKAMLFSASGDETAPVEALGFDPAAQPGDRNGLGCDSADFADVTAGVILLVQPGGCRRHDVVVNAQDAGAVAVVTAYPDWQPGAVLRPTLLTPDDITVPAITTTHEVGLALLAASQAGASVRVAVDASSEATASVNVIAETPGGDPGHVLVVGGHLDSTIDGPGINDNGSGTMTILEIARELARIRLEGAPWKVRMILFTGEETGLIGSLDYVATLPADQRDSIVAYLNFDMLGSPNPVRQVYDVDETSRPGANGVIAGLFVSALESQALTWETIPLGCQADHCPFNQAGVATGGLFSGANEVKTEAQVTLFGGTAGGAQDPCYHLACDTPDNIDAEVLEQLARAAAWVVGSLASGEVQIPEG
jgi:Zn-dependent M28 family amino/carboxypeptidase